MDGDQGEVVFGENGGTKRQIRPDEMDAHQEREEGAEDNGDQREGEVLDADGAVVGEELKTEEVEASTERMTGTEVEDEDPMAGTN